MKLIGVNGFKRSGKDTTFRAIEGALFTRNLPVARRAFADKLKIMAALALGLEGESLELIELMDEFKEVGYLNYGCRGNEEWGDISGRQYLQMFGDKARGVFGDTFWVDQVVPLDPDRFKELWACEPGGHDLPFVGVITDLRYANEAERVLQLGGEVWEIIRPGLESDGHITERPLPRELVTHRFYNDSTLDHFLANISHFINENWLRV